MDDFFRHPFFLNAFLKKRSEPEDKPEAKIVMNGVQVKSVHKVEIYIRTLFLALQ